MGWAASGRNGGFCAASLTHGLAQRTRPLARRVRQAGGARRTATSTPSRRPSPATASTATSSAPARSTSPPSPTRSPNCASRHERGGSDSASARRLETTSDARRGTRTRSTRPTFLGRPVGPARRRHAQPGQARLGPEAGLPRTSAYGSTRTPRHVNSPYGAGMAVRTPYGRVLARQVALGTNVFPSLVERVRPYIVPVYDYALMTEPLSDEQLAVDRLEEPAGPRRQRQPVPLLPAHRATTASCGAATTSSTTYGGRVARRVRPPARRPICKLAGHFFDCFPQLEGLRFSHAWGGAIDTCSRFSAVLRHRARRHASPTRPATPASAWARPGSAPR